MARPKLKAPKNYMLRVLLTTQEAEMLREYAEKHNLTMSELGREQIRQLLASLDASQQPATTAAA